VKSGAGGLAQRLTLGLRLGPLWAALDPTGLSDADDSGSVSNVSVACQRTMAGRFGGPETLSDIPDRRQ